MRKCCATCGRPLPRAKTPLEAFERLVVKTPDGCWGWSLVPMMNGYSSFTFRGEKFAAHRFSYEIHVGYIPDGMCVLHKCDNRACSNPEHLFLGTKLDNSVDMWAKGRGRTWKTPPGENCPTSKLTNQQVVQIRAELSHGDTRLSVAKKYGVSVGCIKMIRSRKTWRHL